MGTQIRTWDMREVDNDGTVVRLDLTDRLELLLLLRELQEPEDLKVRRRYAV